VYFLPLVPRAVLGVGFTIFRNETAAAAAAVRVYFHCLSWYLVHQAEGIRAVPLFGRIIRFPERRTNALHCLPWFTAGLSGGFLFLRPSSLRVMSAYSELRHQVFPLTLPAPFALFFSPFLVLTSSHLTRKGL
jgi:hypothetical protein